MGLPCIRVVLTIVTRWIPQLLLATGQPVEESFYISGKNPRAEPLWGYYKWTINCWRLGTFPTFASVLHSLLHSAQHLEDTQERFSGWWSEEKHLLLFWGEKLCGRYLWTEQKLGKENEYPLAYISLQHFYLAYIINYDNQYL